MRANTSQWGIRMPRPTLDLLAALACGLVAFVGPAPATSAQPYVFVPALAGIAAPVSMASPSNAAAIVFMIVLLG